MADPSTQVDIPARALFKAAEVCELLKVQAYVLRSWEAEFPRLGVTKTAGGPRVYRRKDVEQVARIKHLLLVEGLTLAGARRKLDDESAPVVDDTAGMDELVGQNARERLTAVKRGLNSILELLGSSRGEIRAAAFTLEPPAVRGKPPTAGKGAAARHGRAPAPGPARRKRSA